MKLHDTSNLLKKWQYLNNDKGEPMDLTVDDNEVVKDVDGNILEVEKINFTQSEDQTFTAAASTKDEVTKRFIFKYGFKNHKHSVLFKRLFESILDYMGDAVPSQANMTPEEFFKYIVDFYVQKQKPIEPDEKPFDFEITITQITYGEENTATLIAMLEKFVVDPENNVEQLRNVCEMLHNISKERREETLKLFRNMASALMEPENTPGNA